MSYLTRDQINKLVRIRNHETREAIRAMFLNTNYAKVQKDMAASPPDWYK